MKLGIGTFIRNQPVRFFALVCVAITSAYIMYMGYMLIDIIKSPGWCNRALTADKIAPSGFDALQACIGLLTIQLKGVVTVTYIYAGSLALCLLTLMVIVVAGGHLNFTSPLGSANMGGGEGSPAAEAAAATAGAAVDQAQQIIAEENGGVQVPPGEQG